MKSGLLVASSILALSLGACSNKDSDDGGGNNLLTGFDKCSPGAATGENPLIDDLEDGDGTILQIDGRIGGWYVFNDGTGAQDPVASTETTAEGCAANSVEPPVIGKRACTSGTGMTLWGAALGVSLNAVNCVACAYDASVYQGVRFTLSGTVTGNLRFEIVISDTSGIAWGGNCVDDDVCTDFHGVDITATTEPTVHEVRFADLLQVGWGTPFVFNPAELTNLNWYIHTSGTEISFQNLCVEDVSFF